MVLVPFRRHDHDSFHVVVLVAARDMAVREDSFRICSVRIREQGKPRGAIGAVFFSGLRQALFGSGPCHVSSLRETLSKLAVIPFPTTLSSGAQLYVH